MMNANPAASGVLRLNSAAGAVTRSTILLAVLASTALFSQTLEKTIPLGSVGAGLEYPWLLAVDSATSTVYVASEYGGSILAIDGVSRRRKASVPFASNWCSGIFSLPNQRVIYCVGETLAVAINPVTNTVTGVVLAEDMRCFLGGGVNPYTGKAYLVTDETLMVADAASSRVLKRIWVGEPETDDYGRIVFAANTRNGKSYLFTSDERGDGQVVVLDGVSDTVRAAIPLGDDWLMAMCYEGVNNLLWCVTETDTAALLLAVDGQTDSVVASLSFAPWCFFALCFAREDNKLYVVSDEQCVVVVDAAGRRVLGELRVPDGATAACVNPREHRLYVGCSDSPIAVVDTRDDHWYTDIGAFSEPLALALCPLTNEVWCADCDENTVTAIDCIGDSVVAAVGTISEPTALCLDAAGDRLYIAGLERGRVDVLDTDGDSLLAPLELGFNVGRMCLNPAGNRLFCVSIDSGEVVVVGAATGQTLHRYALSSPRYPAWDSVGDKVYWVGCYAAEVVGSFSGDGSRKLAEIPLGARPRAAWLDPLGRRFYVAADKADGIAVVDCASDSIVAVLPTIARENHRVLAGSPEKHRLYCANKTSLSIYETPAGRVIKKLELGAGPVALHCDPVTGRMFCVLGDTTIVVIDPDGDTVVARFALPMRARVLGSIRASNFVYWVGDSAVGGIDPVALKATGVLRLPALWPFAAGDDDKGRIYVVGLDAVYVIHNRDPEYFLRSRTGPVFIARDAMLYGAQNATLFDITGRAVQTLRPGPNRLVGLVPGTYFLRRNGEAETRKVIITR